MSTATPAQFFAIGLGQEVFEGKFETTEARDAEIQSALDAASAFVAPLADFGYDLVRAECVVAAYDLMIVRGYNPAFSDDELFKRYEEIARMVRLILQGKIAKAETSGDAVGRPRVASEPKRGW